MYTSAVTHLELKQCRILSDTDISSPSTPLVSSQHQILEECTLTLNVDTNASTNHITLDTGDIILTMDDRMITQSSLDSSFLLFRSLFDPFVN